MADEGFKRKLTAILNADVVGYSRLMDDSEEATLQTLNTYRNSMTTLIEQHRGRVVDTTGDNLLAEFTSVVDAVNCSVEIQRKIDELNQELPSDRKMKFRIGVNVGDVVEEDDRIYGDGVNIAARVEGMAEAGGICITGRAFDQVKNKLELGYKFLGEHSVKNIAEPVRVYKILMEPEAVGKVIGEKRVLGKFSRKTAFALIIALAVVAGASIGWNIYLQQSKKIEPASLDKLAFPLPDKPSIAVLRFDYMGDESDKEYIASALSENIISALSKIPDLFVIAKESSFSYKDKEVKIKQISEELGVRYVLEGSLQKSGDHIRVTAQLIDAIKGYHVWSDSYDRELKDFFALQDDITLNILDGLQVELTIFYEGFGKGTKNLEAFFKLHQGLHHVFKLTKEDIDIGRKLYHDAIKIDPEYAYAYYILGWTYLQDVYRGYTESKEQSLKNAEDLARKALELDPSLAECFAMLGTIFSLRGQFEKAIAEGRRAIAIDPNNAEIMAIQAINFLHAFRNEEGLALIERAIRINPKPAPYYFRVLGAANMGLGRYSKAIEVFKTVVNKSPNDMLAWRTLAICYVLTDQIDEAEKAAAEVLRIQPAFCIDLYKTMFKLSEEEDKGKLYINALRKAGIPEHPKSN